ncbi:MAG: beta-phosphoglucomutase [Protaetiibacter sp.]
MFDTIRAVVFDLDGVLVDTAQFHLAAWRRIAHELGFEFDDSIGEALKGVGRETALGIVLDAGEVTLDAAALTATASRKNRYYNEHLDSLDPSALLPGAEDALARLRAHGIPVALASASRNARTILRTTGIESSFDAVVDGLVVTRAKPDPTVFLVAAERLGVPPEQCLVFEDALAGVEGARRAGCMVVGVGDPAVLTEADAVVPTLADFDWSELTEGATR